MGPPREAKAESRRDLGDRLGQGVVTALWRTGRKVLGLMAMGLLAGCAPSPPYPLYGRPPPPEIYPYQEPSYPFQEQEEQEQREHEQMQEQDDRHGHGEGEEHGRREGEWQQQE
ncbi:MAG: hypothetical protein M0037_06450 [Betaproteobacteria bacterium]|nr:hypothetical protein [Betaproteobacteria bacterium]